MSSQHPLAPYQLDDFGHCHCGSMRSPVLLCRGQRRKENKGRFYQICIKEEKEKGLENKCEGFFWRDDLLALYNASIRASSLLAQLPASSHTTPPPPQSSSTCPSEKSCKGPLCQSSQPRKFNSECSFSLCKACCCHFQKTLSQRCAVSAHKEVREETVTQAVNMN
jgi:hypothetical protein